ncbi:MAG: hypothetical protein U0P81_08440 [Holophagaceae bacterium]
MTSSRSEAGDPEREGPTGEPEGLVIQDTFRKVYFGQISDPLIPEPRVPVETPEDELTRAALTDPDALKGEIVEGAPTPWRWVFLLLLAVAALAIIFWKR